jgi:hypothetical protein
MRLERVLRRKLEVSCSCLKILDIEIFLGEDNGADLEEDEEDDGVVEEEIDEILATEENKDDRIGSQLRQSHNADRGMEGFEGIVGIGAGGKKVSGVF